MRAASYARYSSTLQEEGHSVSAQLAANRSLIESRGWELVGTYVDEAESGATTERRRLQRMLAHARAGRCDVIVVHKLDRLTRSLIDLLLMIRELEQAGVKLVSTAEQFDFTSPIGRVVMVMLVALAEWFLSNLRAETAKGKRARAAKGFTNAPRAPFGYAPRYEKDGLDGIPVPINQEADVVRWMFKEYATGHVSDRELARQLNVRGIRLRAFGRRAVVRWGNTTVAWLLKNRFYLGEVQYHGEWTKGWHEPIVSEDLFDRCQEIRDERRRKRPTARHDAAIFALSGLVTCSRCDGPMHGHKFQSRYRGRTYEYSYYFCTNKKTSRSCDAPSVRQAVVEEIVGQRLRELRPPADWRERIRESRAAQQEEPDTSAADRARLEAELERVKVLFEMGDRTLQAYVRRRDEIQRELMRLRPPRRVDFDLAGQLLNDAGQTWELANPEQRRRLARTLISSVRLDGEADGGPVVSIAFRPEIQKMLEALALKSELQVSS